MSSDEGRAALGKLYAAIGVQGTPAPNTADPSWPGWPRLLPNARQVMQSWLAGALPGGGPSTMQFYLRIDPDEAIADGAPTEPVTLYRVVLAKAGHRWCVAITPTGQVVLAGPLLPKGLL